MTPRQEFHVLVPSFKLYLMVILEWFGDKKDAMLQAFPKVKALDDEIRNHPKVKAYLEKRPKTDH